MAVLGSTLGLLLCLGLLFSPASARNHSEHCMPFTNIVASSGPGIQVNATVYENITIYTVLVPVNKNISSVAMRAADTNNSSAGTWEGADEYCNSSVLYHVKDSDTDRGLFETKWVYPNSEHKTEVILKDNYNHEPQDLFTTSHNLPYLFNQAKHVPSHSSNHTHNPHPTHDSTHHQFSQHSLPQPHRQYHSDPASLSH
ncbi:Placenta-expressed transcript 1 protein [Galemys pyrenaicus]|uniref:Placenta-expressed transcript 1 protein n=1 Tax=Galemys pyrenaicus TaxID=202257 RepID=A0A8J6AHU1_GALPY|nr:Placenta-expressed transcript 1 protein [Galemys pyrenaicus]